MHGRNEYRASLIRMLACSAFFRSSAGLQHQQKVRHALSDRLATCPPLPPFITLTSVALYDQAGCRCRSWIIYRKHKEKHYELDACTVGWLRRSRDFCGCRADT